MNIIVAYKQSRLSKKVLDLAKEHAKVFGAKMYLLSSLEGGGKESAEEIGNVKNDLEYARSLVEKDGIDCVPHLLIHGLTPGEDIIEFAKDNSADEIVVGVEKKSKVGKFLLGSNAQYIILNAHCPVVTVKL